MDNARKLNINLGESISAMRYFLKSFQVRTKLYKLFFKGKSFDFVGFRDYVTGDDDVSTIDWKTSNRGNKLLVKQYREEEDKKVIFLLDVGDNMVFGTTEKLKCEYAAELVLSLSDLVINNNDRAGLILFNENFKEYYIPRRGKQQFDMFLDILSDSGTYGGGSNIFTALDFIQKNSEKGVSSLVIVSDFINFDKKARHALELVASRYETIAFIVKDPIDKSLPKMGGEFVIESPTSGEQLLINPRLANKNYEKHVSKQENFVKESFKNADVDFLELSTSKPFVFEAIEFLKGRVEKRGHS